MLQPNMVPVELNNNNGDDETNVNNNNNNISGGMNLRDEELDSGNTSENPEGGLGNNQDRRPSKRKRYHRHTQHQIQEMESFFKECPHPDDKQRKDLSRQLGLDHLQIKFWFQNKRTQNKNQLERHENTQLRAENDNLRGDNQRYREAIINASCPSCGNHTAIGEMSFEEHHLRLENAKLNEEIHQLSALAATVTGKQVRSYPAMSSPPVPTRADGMGSMGREVYANMDNLSIRRISGVNDADKPMIIELALGAMDELIRMAQAGEPLWKGGANGAPFALNFNEYARTFCNGLGPVPNGFRLEASKETAVVFMNPRDIVERLMNVNQWSTAFAGMVGKAMTHEALLIGINGNYDGAFHLMTAEYKVLSPLVSTRESCFVRYCKHQGDGIWAVVDVSIDQFVPTMELNCRRRPSGCLIQDIGNGCASRVTWVEHVEVDDRGTVHGFFKQYMNSGQALGAKRWVATLNHMAERLALATSNITTLERSDLIQLSSQAKKSVLKLADRMSYGFFSGVTDSNTDVWCTLPGYTSENVKLMTRKSVNDPGVPPGVILCAATSFWVSVPHQVVFDFLRDEKNRVNWDVLTNGAISHKISQIVTGRDTKNCIALYRSVHTNQRKMMMIQEHSTDPTASYVIYAPVDLSAMDRVLKGGDPDFVPAIPSGFAVLPDGMAPPGSEGGGSILNVAFQVLAETNPSAMLTVSSVATVENLILSTVQRIKAYFHFQIE